MSAKPAAREHQLELVGEVEGDLDPAQLLGEQLVPTPVEGAHLDGDTLRQRIHLHDPRPELQLGAVGDRSPVTRVSPGSRQLLPLLLRPVRPQERVRVRHLVVEHERPAGLEVLVQATQPLAVVLASAAEPEAAADDDRAVATRQVELVHRLRVEVRLRQLLALAALADALEHVGRDVRAVDVEPCLEIGHEQPPGAARGIERRLAGLDELPEPVDLRPVEVELRPPARDEAVVPGLRAGGRTHTVILSGNRWKWTNRPASI